MTPESEALLPALSLGGTLDLPREWTCPVDRRVPYTGTVGVPLPESAGSALHYARRLYSLAIQSALEAESEQPEPRPTSSSGLVWDDSSVRFPGEDLAAHLARYGQVFDRLSTLYLTSLVSPSSNLPSDEIVRSGLETLAAIRLLPYYNARPLSPALGTMARNNSPLSVLGWKPQRETELAELASSRRKEKKQAEAAASSKKITKGVAFEEPKALIRHNPSWKQNRSSRSGKRTTKYFEQPCKTRQDTATPFQDEADGTKDAPRNAMPVASEDAMLSLGSKKRNSGMNWCKGIDWNIPDYSRGLDIPELKLPPPMGLRGGKLNETGPAVITTDTFSMPYSVRRPPTEPVSPMSSPPVPPTTMPVNAAPGIVRSATVTAEPIPVENPCIEPLDDAPPQHIQSGSLTRVGLQKFKNVLKYVSRPVVAVRPHSSSFSSKGSASTATTTASSSFNISPLMNHMPRMPKLFPPKPIPRLSEDPHPGTKVVSSITLYAGTETTSERFMTNNTPSPPVSRTSNASLLVRETTKDSKDSRRTASANPKPQKKQQKEVFTRTEEEYQEVVRSLARALQEITEMKLTQAEEIRKERGRSRGRKQPSSIRSRSRTRSRSRDTIRRVRE